LAPDSTGHPPLWMSGRKRMSGIPREIAPPTGTDQNQIAAAFTRWRDSLESVRRSIDEATAAVGLLRATLHEMAPLWRSLEQLEQALTSSDLAGTIDQATAAAQEAVAKSASLAPRPVTVSEDVATPEREESEVEAPWSESPALSHAGRTRPALDVPTMATGFQFSYTVTVEDVGAKVKLVPLHQSLSQVQGVRELSLKSYANGIAVVCIDSEVELEAQVLQEAISDGMSKACRITAGEGPSFLVRMSSEAASRERRQRAAVR
jgi:hypothetical protein